VVHAEAEGRALGALWRCKEAETNQTDQNPRRGGIRLPPKRHTERADDCHVLNTGLMLKSYPLNHQRGHAPFLACHHQPEQKSQLSVAGGK
jgi:hypothetical protein